MKKVLLPLVFVFSFGLFSNASNSQVSEKVNVEIFQAKLNTICKLIQMGDIEGVKNLINNGTNINQKSCGMTPLMYAARQNKTEILNLLISRGAKLNTRSDKGYTALDYAKNSKAIDCYNIIAKAMNV